MAHNYSRDDMEKQGNAAVGVGTTALLGLAGLLAKAFIDNKQRSNNIKNNNLINAQIADTDRKINSYENRFWGRHLYADEISALESQREQLRKKLK